VTDLLKQALLALDAGSTPQQFDLVAGVLAESADRGTMRLLDRAARDDRPLAARYRETAKLEADPFTVLDLVTAFASRSGDARSCNVIRRISNFGTVILEPSKEALRR
jgi:hypothetical protein